MDERRHYHRLYTQEYAHSYDYDIGLDGKCYRAKLLDVSHSGARFLLENEPWSDPNDKEASLSPALFAAGGIGYSVVWRIGNEVGVSFYAQQPNRCGFLHDIYGNA